MILGIIRGSTKENILQVVEAAFTGGLKPARAGKFYLTSLDKLYKMNMLMRIYRYLLKFFSFFAEKLGGGVEMRFQEMHLIADVFREDDHFIAYCKPLDLATQGKTFEEAQKRFASLVPQFIADLEKKGTLDEILLELGWQKIEHMWSAPVKVGEVPSVVSIPCPA